jgi:hypothetical protein
MWKKIACKEFFSGDLENTLCTRLHKIFILYILWCRFNGRVLAKCKFFPDLANFKSDY